jgi:hypothetical protein
MVKVFPEGTRTRFVDLVCGGESLEAAAHAVGASDGSGTRWWRQSGGMRLDSTRTGGGLADRASDHAMAGSRFLTLPERVTIQVGLRTGWSKSRIADEIGRHRSVVGREIERNQAPDGIYYATRAHNNAHHVRRRPKTPILVRNPQLARFVEDAMDEGWSPKLISRALTDWFPDDGSMQISHETIYRALYVQTRGTLRADLAKQLSTGRTARAPRGSTRSSSPYKDAFRISERPAEVEDRAVPGHWEGDLIIGSGKTAIGTLVERTSRFVLLLHIDDRRDERPPRPPAAQHHLGPRQRTGRLPADHRGTERPGLFLRPALALAAREQREHQPAAAPLVREGLRPLGPRPRRTHPRPERAEPPTAPDTRHADPDPTPRPAARSRLTTRPRCIHHLT